MLTLASASPRRRELIKKVTTHKVLICPSRSDENIGVAEPRVLARQLALIKAKEVYNRKGGIVIGADTVVALGSRVLGKPTGEAQAREYLEMLSERTHEVITGVAVVGRDKEVSDIEVTRVTFEKLPPDFIEEYVAGGSPMDKAGAYGLQDEMLSRFVKNVDGDRDNVVGLPVELLKRILKENFDGCL